MVLDFVVIGVISIEAAFTDEGERTIFPSMYADFYNM
jgi:hypothetical protein